MIFFITSGRVSLNLRLMLVLTCYRLSTDHLKMVLVLQYSFVNASFFCKCAVYPFHVCVSGWLSV